MSYSSERITARERLPGTHASVSICNIHRCITNLYFHVPWIIKGRPVNFGELRTVFY